MDRKLALSAPDGRPRCPWALSDALSLRYHDEEWGVPVTDDRGLLEFLVLEGAQAGLSWRTVLAKRDGYRRAFSHFDPVYMAGLDDQRLWDLASAHGLIKNGAKLRAAVQNARAALAVAEHEGSFGAWLWALSGGATTHNRWSHPGEVPSETAVSRSMSRELRRRGFRFVGPTVCYALMQATGMVQDHLVGCFRYRELAGLPSSDQRAQDSTKVR
jgi:DNA-3-methyladenine glycosylase I